jgi:hypothetical protein
LDETTSPDDTLVEHALDRVHEKLTQFQRILDTEEHSPLAMSMHSDLTHAMIELVHTPAESIANCVKKLETIQSSADYFIDGDDTLLHCYKTWSVEITNLIASKPRNGMLLPRKMDAYSRNKSVRWFLGLAVALPSVLINRWQSGGLS